MGDTHVHERIRAEASAMPLGGASTEWEHDFWSGWSRGAAARSTGTGYRLPLRHGAPARRSGRLPSHPRCQSPGAVSPESLPQGVACKRDRTGCRRADRPGGIYRTWCRRCQEHRCGTGTGGPEASTGGPEASTAPRRHAESVAASGRRSRGIRVPPTAVDLDIWILLRPRPPGRLRAVMSPPGQVVMPPSRRE